MNDPSDNARAGAALFCVFAPDQTSCMPLISAPAKANTRANNCVSPCPLPSHVVDGVVGNVWSVAWKFATSGDRRARDATPYGSEGWGFESLQAR